MQNERVVDGYQEDGDDYTYTTVISLYNPITKAHILLRPILEMDLEGRPIHDAQICCNPSTASPGQPLVSNIYGLNDILIYWQGYDFWSSIDGGETDIAVSIVYHEAEAMLYVLYIGGRLALLHLSSSIIPRLASPLTYFSPTEIEDEDKDEDIDSSTLLRQLEGTSSLEIASLYGQKHLVLAAGNLFLVVGRDCSDWGLPRYERPQYHVFKLGKSRKKGYFKWVRAASIGEHALFACSNHIISMVCDPADFTDARANQIYHFKKHRHISVGSNKNISKIPVDVKVWDIVAGANSSVDGEQLSFKTSKILRRLSSDRCYTDFAAWMVPSPELKD